MLNTFTEYFAGFTTGAIALRLLFAAVQWLYHRTGTGNKASSCRNADFCAGLSRGGGLCHRKYLSGDGFRNRADRLKPYSGQA